MNDIELSPHVRFDGYEGPWNVKNIGENSEIMAGGTPSTTNLSYWYPKEIPWLSSGEVHKKRIQSSNDKISAVGLINSSARWVKSHSILIALAGQGKTRGTVALNEIPLTTNQSIAAIELNEELNYEFTFYNLEKRYEELRLISAVDGSRGGLNKRLIKKINLYAPQSIDEQEKIGKMLARIDRTIVLKTQELTKLNQFKQAMLQKMYLKESKLVPEVRFEGFDNEWELVSLSDIGKISMGQSPVGDSYTSNPDDHILIQGNADLKEGEVVPRVWTTQVTKTAIPGDIIMSVRAPVGDIGKTRYHAVLGRGVAGIRANSFVYYYLESLKANNYWDKFSTGSTFQSIKSKQIKELELRVPTIREQALIGEQFKTLDKHIKAKKDELTKLRQFKRAMLNNMFV